MTFQNIVRFIVFKIQSRVVAVKTALIVKGAFFQQLRTLLALSIPIISDECVTA